MTDAGHLTELQAHLKKEIKAAHEAVKQPLSAEAVATIVTQVVRSLEGDISSTDLKFYSDIKDLASYIRQAKNDIASIKPRDISTDHIPSATDELDAVVGATEEATNKIMDVCDEITAIAGTCTPENNEKLVGCTTKIFEACNFQDITGQRITKVVQTLKHIDDKIGAIVTAMGDELERFEGVEKKPKHIHEGDPNPEKGLLNGPQLAGKGVAQDDIDKLLAGN